MSPAVPRVEPRTVVVQPTALCNLDCAYCYVPDRRDRTVMTADVLDASAEFIFGCHLPPGEIEFHWHAGEPLAAGLAFYERAFAVLAERAPPHVRLRHTIQTNGTLLTRRWCELLAEYRVQVGLSVDGPADLHDRSRRTLSGRGTHARVMAGYRLLRDHGISPGAICVLRRGSFEFPDRIYDFFVEAGFASVAFNVEESEGVYLRSELLRARPGDIRQSYVAFMRRIWQRWWSDRCAIEIREFHQLLGCLVRLRQDASFVREPAETVPFRILTIRRDGAIGTFSPELASTPSPEYGAFVLGNVVTDTPTQVARGVAFQRLHRDIAVGRNRCREVCGYFPVCGAAFQSNRFTEHGSFRATETLTCRLHRQALTDVIVDELARPVHDRRNRAPG
ncbi:cyclophane-forming radical SAM/SPASM peptide maturase GrrM/OscB [Micromonospora sp. IBSANI012]|uniref:cyclophane-forming radical SAM/SPASM peptide maturase GrrM/OscB n=1 Tax=Micromonospora sp. IBSANI012 TaxID=3457761 RepID=UPI004059FB3B